MFTIIEYVMYAIIGVYGVLLPVALAYDIGVEAYDAMKKKQYFQVPGGYGSRVLDILYGTGGPLIVLWLINQI